MSSPLPPDFFDLFLCLNEARAEYMLVGGYAVNIHGYLRTTEDLDVWVKASPENAARVFEAMLRFGLPPGLNAAELADISGSPPTGFRFGRRPFAVDLLTSIKGVSFDEAWPTSEIHRVDGLDLRVIGLGKLVQNKRATGRLKDAADVEELLRIHRET